MLCRQLAPVMIQQREGGCGNYQQNIAIFGPDLSLTHANCNSEAQLLENWKNSILAMIYENSQIVLKYKFYEYVNRAIV